MVGVELKDNQTIVVFEGKTTTINRPPGRPADDSHNQVRGHRTDSSHSGAEEYPRGKTQTKVVHAYFTADAIHASTRNI